MGYTMCSDGGFSWYYFGKHDYDADFPKAQLPQEFVFPLMSIPEIKPLVVEAFYSRNMFQIREKRAWYDTMEEAGVTQSMHGRPVLTQVLLSG
jgi:hypothetical protein